MTSSKPTIVLVHGGWHVPSTYSKLTNALESAGYEVHVPALPSMNGARPPTADLATDTAFIRSYVEKLADAGRTVIAIMHSYGGQVATNALTSLGLEIRAKRGLKGGVAHLVYMCAFALTEGVSMIDKVKEFGHEHLLPLAFDFADDGTVLNRDPKMLLIGPGVEDVEAEAYVSSLRVWNGATMSQPLKECAWREIPVTYIYTTQDMTTPFDYQKSMVEKMRDEGQEVDTVELETGHSPNLTRTKEVVDAINQVAGRLQA
jgi:pimeloyl-ACP methyl ester carboxylesterase